MIKYVALISVLVFMGEAQRPPYAGSANRYPQVLPRFQEEQLVTSSSASPMTSSSGVGNRVGEDVASSTFAPSVANNQRPFAGPVTPKADLPVNALGDADLVERIKTWPEELRPFWYTNRVQIDQHLHPQGQQNIVRPQTGAGSFVG